MDKNWVDYDSMRSLIFLSINFARSRYCTNMTRMTGTTNTSYPGFFI